MKPLVPLSRQVRFGEDGAEDQTPGAGPLPRHRNDSPFTLCKLDFREGCYQINFSRRPAW
jgi:hypothetical protein